MQRKYMSELSQGDIVMLYHTNDYDKDSYHPFLILYVSSRRILGLQFSSMYETGNSYFADLNENEKWILTYSWNDIILEDKIVLQNSGLKYTSAASPELLYIFDIKNNVKVKWINELDDNTFFEILNQISKSGWKKEIQDLVNNL